jgi:hypothetical protein
MDVKNPGIVNVAMQAFAPNLAVDAFVFPTPPLNPTLAAAQGVPFSMSLADLIPTVGPTITPETFPSINPSFVTVSPTGNNYETQPNKAIRTYTIASVVDARTLLAPDAATQSLLITFVAGLPLQTYGLDLANRLLTFLTGAWIPANTPYPERLIVQVVGALSLTVPNASPDGQSAFTWPVGGPTAGDTVMFDTARTNSENIFGPGGGDLITVPAPPPFIDTTGVLVGPTIDVFVSDQETTNGTPIEVHIV